jgi:hypothetical protein
MGQFYNDPTQVKEYAPPQYDEEPLAIEVDWTKEEEAKAKRKSVVLSTT